MKKEIKEEIKKLKDRAKKVEKAQDLHLSLDFRYERITGRPDKPEYSKLYAVGDILKNETIKDFEIKINADQIVVFEFVDFKQAPKEFVIIYNEFNNKEQTDIDMYILKGEK